MTKVILPIHEESLQSIHEASRAESLKSFDQQHFGRHHAKKSHMFSGQNGSTTSKK
ncbi:hypothetical protein Hanom_Chr14g01315641 [Helianthus anomalus]